MGWTADNIKKFVYMNCTPKNPIAALITSRLSVLGLSRRALVDRTGYRNTSKGLRRLDSLLAGDLTTTADLVSRLPAALDLPARLVTEAVEATQIALEARRKAKERASFVPHAILLTARTVPSSITLFAVTGGARWLRVDFRPDTAPETFVSQVQETLKHRLAMLGGAIPFLGAVTGFIVNFSLDLAVRYDLEGHVVDAFPEHRRQPQCDISLANGRSLSTILR